MKINTTTQILLILQVSLILIKSTTEYQCKDHRLRVTEFLNFQQQLLPCVYSGILQLDSQNTKGVYFMYIQAMRSKYTSDPKTPPLAIWIDEPGKSVLFSLFNEVSPFKLTENLNLHVNHYKSINQNSDILFLDFPGSTGYSYGPDLSEIPDIRKDFTITLEKFFLEFAAILDYTPQSNNLYMLGHSWLIPELSEEVLAAGYPLKKIAMLSTVVDAATQPMLRKDIARGLNLLSSSDEQDYNSMVQACEFETIVKKDNSKCEGLLPFIVNLSGQVYEYDVRYSHYHDDQTYHNLSTVLNREKTLEQLNIKDKVKERQTASRFWLPNNPEVKLSMRNNIFSAYKNNLSVPMYYLDGQYNLEFSNTEAALDILSADFRKQEREYWKTLGFFNAPIKGYIKQTDQLIYLNFKDAGKYLPRDQPQTFKSFFEQHFIGDQASRIPCMDKKCDVFKEQCEILAMCNGNGVCDVEKSGRCTCTESFYGSDCSHKAEHLNRFTKLKLSPKDVRVFTLAEYKDDLLIEISSDLPNSVISLLSKQNHHMLFDYSKHMYFDRMVSNRMVFFVEEELAREYLLVLSNLEFDQEIEIRTNIVPYNTKTTQFFAPGGLGFGISIILFAVGIALLVATSYLSKRIGSVSTRVKRHEGLMMVNTEKSESGLEEVEQK